MKGSWCQHRVQTEHTPPTTWPPLKFYFTRPVFLLCLWSRLFVSRSSASKLLLSLSRRKSLCCESESLSEWLADGVSEPWLAGDDDLEGDSKNFLIEGWLRIVASHDLVPCNKLVRQICHYFPAAQIKTEAAPEAEQSVNIWRKSKYLISCLAGKTYAAKDKSLHRFYRNWTPNWICSFRPFDLRNPPGFGKEDCSLLPLWKYQLPFLRRHLRSYTTQKAPAARFLQASGVRKCIRLFSFDADWQCCLRLWGKLHVLAPCLLPELNGAQRITGLGSLANFPQNAHLSANLRLS